MFKLGLIVNPASHRKAERPPQSDMTSFEQPTWEQALISLQSTIKPFEIVTCSGEMGQSLCRKLRLQHEIMHRACYPSTAQDTCIAAKKMSRLGIDMIFFIGGDKTAELILSSVASGTPVIGIDGCSKKSSPIFLSSCEVAALLTQCVKQEKTVSIE